MTETTLDTSRPGDTEPAALSARSVPFLRGGRGILRRSPGDVRGWIAILILLGVGLAPLAGLWRLPGGPMEEGFMLVFPERILDGDLPNRDFLHLYGPGSLYVLAGWYALFGVAIEAERALGLLQHLATVSALVILASAWGRRVAVAVGSLTTVFVLTATGLVAFAWSGAVALGLWGIVAGVRALALEEASARRARRWWTATGCLTGLALTYRPDLVLALGAVLTILLMIEPTADLADRRGRAWRRRGAALGRGMLLGTLPMSVHLVLVGPARAFEGMFWDPVVRLRAGRALPRPPSWDRLDGFFQVLAETVPPWWDLPHLPASHSLTLWFAAIVIVAVTTTGLATFRWWRDRSFDAAVVLVVAWFALGMLPQGLQRPDSTHLALAASVGWPWAIVVAVAWWRRRGGPRPRHAILAALVMGLLVALVTPLFTLRPYLFALRLGAGQLPAPVVLERGDRHFLLGDDRVARAYRQVFDILDAQARPGQRLLVAPADLSRTPYVDTFVYHLLPELEPATYHLEMEPGIANAPGSSLAEDLLTADWVILSRVWENWSEPNTSNDPGSTTPNQILTERFCQVASFEEDLVRLVRRCDAISEPGPDASPP